LIELEPDKPLLLIQKAYSAVNGKGDLTTFRAVLERLPSSMKDEAISVQFAYALSARDWTTAKEILSRSTDAELYYFNADSTVPRGCLEISPHQAITHPQDEVKAYIVRITKGLLRNFYPNLDYREHVFSVDHLNPLPADDVGMLIANFTHDFRGDGVFRFFRGVISEPCMGIWVYLFYERVWFMATHGRADVLKSYPGFASVES
jgi:hypothetical protein